MGLPWETVDPAAPGFLIRADWKGVSWEQPGQFRGYHINSGQRKEASLGWGGGWGVGGVVFNLQVIEEKTSQEQDGWLEEGLKEG